VVALLPPFLLHHPVELLTRVQVCISIERKGFEVGFRF